MLARLLEDVLQHAALGQPQVGQFPVPARQGSVQRAASRRRGAGEAAEGGLDALVDPAFLLVEHRVGQQADVVGGVAQGQLRIGIASLPGIRRVAKIAVSRWFGSGAWRRTSCRPPSLNIMSRRFSFGRNGSSGTPIACQACSPRWRGRYSAGNTAAATPTAPISGTKKARLKRNSGLHGSGNL